MTLSTVAYDLDRLQQLYAGGFQDAFLDTAVRRIIDHQIGRDEADLVRVREDLARLEQRYGWDSDTFWARYQSGELQDLADYVEWSALCKMKQRLTSRLDILRGEVAHE